MSHVRWSSASGSVEIAGPERFWFKHLVDSTFIALLDLDHPLDGVPVLRLLRPTDHYALRREGPSGQIDTRSLETSLRVGMGDLHFLVDGIKMQPDELALNTAIAIGDDPLKLAARIHGECEAGMYVEGQDRKWVAAIIRQGRATDMYRPRGNWEALIEFLESNSTEVVVTSFSGTDSFPRYDYALASKQWDGSYEAWDNLPDETRWRLSVDGLRHAHPYLHLTPAGLRKGFYGPGAKRRYTVFDLHRAAHEIVENEVPTNYGRTYTDGPDGRAAWTTP